jgi:threonine/homoserine/homoserine lactone efflux protein
MSLESSITFFIAILIFAFIPGPGVFAVIARALAFGAPRCLALVVGIAASDIVYLMLACRGLSFVAENWNHVFTAVRFVGAAYLCYLGWKIWTAPTDGSGLAADSLCKTSDNAKGFVQGFLISASNPKVILFYIAFLPTFMDLGNMNGADLLLAASLTFTGLILALMTIAIGAASARRCFQSEKAMHRLNKTAGATMIGAGTYMVARN